MRRNMSEEEKQKRIKVREFLKQNPISSPDGLNTFFKDMIKVMIEEFYQGELEEELGYTKYDYRNKDSNNSRNGYSSKKLKSSAGEIEVNIPRDINSEYEPQVIKKHQNTIGQDLEAKIISIYAIHFVKKAVYIAIGISSSREKDVIGMWVGENESVKFWLSKLNELKSRGVEDILIASICVI